MLNYFENKKSLQLVGKSLCVWGGHQLKEIFFFLVIFMKLYSPQIKSHWQWKFLLFVFFIFSLFFFFNFRFLRWTEILLPCGKNTHKWSLKLQIYFATHVFFSRLWYSVSAFFIFFSLLTKSLPPLWFGSSFGLLLVLLKFP